MPDQGQFIEPPPWGDADAGDYSNLKNYNIGSVMNVQWSKLPAPGTVLWLMENGGDLFCKELNVNVTSCQALLRSNQGLSYQWYVSAPQNYTSKSTVYYLEMRDGQNGTLYFLSHYFNILPQDFNTLSSTSSPSSTTATIASTSSGPSLTASLTIATSTPLPSGFDSSTKTAIGIAVGLGVPFFAILATIAFLLYRNNKRKSNQVVPGHTHMSHASDPGARSEYRISQQKLAGQVCQPWEVPQELIGDTNLNQHASPAELSSSSYRRG